MSEILKQVQDDTMRTWWVTGDGVALVLSFSLRLASAILRRVR